MLIIIILLLVFVFTVYVSSTAGEDDLGVDAILELAIFCVLSVPFPRYHSRVPQTIRMR